MIYTFPNGNTLTLALTREPGRATWIKRRDYAFNDNELYWHRTAYDAEGRPTETEDSLTATRQWLYNRRSELVGATGTQTHPYDYMYSYDSIGNRTSSTENGISSTYAANCLNQYTAVNRTIDQSQQLVLRSFSEGGSNNFTYDADGNLLQDDRFTYTYDCENRLMSVTPRNPYSFNAVVNAYDHRSRRIRKEVFGYHDGDWRYHETHRFVWDGWNIVLEQVSNGDQVIHTIEYFWGNDVSGTEEGAGGVGGLLATRIDGVFYIPVYGANGNIMMYVDETGTIAAQFDYDPYGRVLVAPNYWENLWNFGFSTKYHDWESDLIVYQLRTYDPVNGRWLNRDPIEEAGGENLYMLCLNSPGFRFDVQGLSCTVGTFNVTTNIDIKVKSALYGGDEILVDGKSLLDSLSLLNRFIQMSSLYGNAPGVVVSVVDNLVGEGVSPETATALRAIGQMMEKLKSGPLIVYGRLEWEKCKCVSGKTKFVTQSPIDEEEEVPVENLYSDPKALSNARRKVLQDLISTMYSRLGKRK